MIGLRLWPCTNRAIDKTANPEKKSNGNALLSIVDLYFPKIWFSLIDHVFWLAVFMEPVFLKVAGEREMLLDDNPAAVPFLEHARPARILPSRRFAFISVDIVQDAIEPGDLAAAGERN